MWGPGLIFIFNTSGPLKSPRICPQDEPLKLLTRQTTERERGKAWGQEAKLDRKVGRKRERERANEKGFGGECYEVMLVIVVGWVEEGEPNTIRRLEWIRLD